MKRSILAHGPGWLISLCVIHLVCGCASHGPKPGRYPLRVEVDTALADDAMQVDFIADPDPAHPQDFWAQLNVNEYWTNGPLRRDAHPITLKFGPGQPRVQTIAISEETYAGWLKKKPLYAVILKDNPSRLEPAGPSDPRRLLLSLDERDWIRKAKELKILIQESGMKVETPPRPKKR
jgi:hypothetical protein